MTRDQLSPLPNPYKTGVSAGIPIVKELLNPDLKKLIDLMHSYKQCYVGVTSIGAWLYINNEPSLKINNAVVEDLKIILADSIKEYYDLTEYRLLPERYKQIITYYL